MVDRGDGASWLLGRTYWSEGPPLVEVGLDEALNRYTLEAGAGSATIVLSDGIVAEYPDIVQLLEQSITSGSGATMPTVELSPPLRWATDNELSLQMEVAYDGFAVRRGCGELAVVCSPTGVVQVIAADRVDSNVPGFPLQPVWIVSPLSRPIDSASYLDPGPLSIRGNHDVLWTGDEMIVWGGSGGDTIATLTDGAAFDPDTSEWRMLPPFPVDRATVSRAVWADGRMIVVAPEGTFALDPGGDEWTAIGNGLYPPDAPGMMVWTGDSVAAWTSEGIYVFTPDTGAWEQLPDSGGGTGDRWDSALRIVDGTLYAIGSAGYCGGRQVARWAGDAWESLPRLVLDGGEYADCSSPSQTGVAGGRLVAWEDDIHETVAYDPAGAAWVPVDTVPLSGTEGPSSAVQLDDGFLVPQYGEGAMFDGASDAWTYVVLPGSGEATEMVWTGEEILMWGEPCCFGDRRGWPRHHGCLAMGPTGLTLLASKRAIYCPFGRQNRI